jgi:hypothetical protein
LKPAALSLFAAHAVQARQNAFTIHAGRGMFVRHVPQTIAN